MASKKKKTAKAVKSPAKKPKARKRRKPKPVPAPKPRTVTSRLDDLEKGQAALTGIAKAIKNAVV